MKIVLKIFGVFVTLFLLLTSASYPINMFKTSLHVYAESANEQKAENITIHLFHSKTCPHCKKEISFLSTLPAKYPSLTINQYEITGVGQNLKLFVKVGEKLGATSGSVPFLVIGNEYIVGYSTDTTTGVEIESKIQQMLLNSPEDIVTQVIQDQRIKPKVETIGNTGVVNTETGPNINFLQEDTFINIPFVGNFNLKGLSLPAITFIIALLDGFNPCAMWVLLFLISMLLGIGDRRKMWIIGLTFIISSGFVYFLFLSAWLNAFLLLGYAVILRYAIGLLALGIGIFYIRKYILSKNDGCEVMGDSKRQKVFDKIKTIIQQQNLLLAVGGTILLAGAVNIVELLCSAGLPAIYTKILSMTPMPAVQYYIYLIFYILVFMLDDIIVFIIAMTTLQAVGIKNKYAKYSQLVGAILMVIIGILMLFKPEILMFG